MVDSQENLLRNTLSGHTSHKLTGEPAGPAPDPGAWPVAHPVVARCASRYTCCVIQSFAHKGLKRFYDTGSTVGVQASHRKKLRLQLAALDTAQTVDDMDIPGFRLHRLKGKRAETWAIDVSGNWRLTFRFEDGQVHDVNYEDYH